MESSTARALLLAWFVSGCGVPKVDEVSGASMSTETSHHLDSTAGVADEGSANADSEDGGSFIAPPDARPPDFPCDTWTQDCPAGEKCVPSSDGHRWNGTRCTPVQPNAGRRGDRCLADPDSCGVGLFCWVAIVATTEGRCVELCLGWFDTAHCSHPDDACFVNGDGVANLCLPSCDPLVQNCVDGLACVWSPQGFACVDDTSLADAFLGEPCSDAVFGCRRGLHCSPAAWVPDCPDHQQCCTSYCDRTAPDGGSSACLPGQICGPHLGEQPPQLQHLGVCAMPR